MDNFIDFFEKMNGSFPMRVREKKILTEGLITSYPVDSVIARFVRDDIDVYFHKIEKNPIGKDSWTIKITLDNQWAASVKFIERIKKILDVYGYYISLITTLDKDYKQILIEPKYPFIIDHKYLKGYRCYHITNKKHLKKIQKYGLVPKTSKSRFYFNGNRIYLLFLDDRNPDILIQLAIQLMFDKQWKPNDVAILEVSDYSDQELYFDPTFGESIDDTEKKGMYPTFTLTNISPDYLKVIN